MRRNPYTEMLGSRMGFWEGFFSEPDETGDWSTPPRRPVLLGTRDSTLLDWWNIGRDMRIAARKFATSR